MITYLESSIHSTPYSPQNSTPLEHSELAFINITIIKYTGEVVKVAWEEGRGGVIERERERENGGYHPHIRILLCIRMLTKQYSKWKTVCVVPTLYVCVNINLIVHRAQYLIGSKWLK